MISILEDAFIKLYFVVRTTRYQVFEIGEQIKSVVTKFNDRTRIELRNLAEVTCN